MSSIEIMVSDCTESDIIAEDVVNPNGLTVLVRGAVITDYIKKRLTEMGIEKVTVYNSMERPGKKKKSIQRKVKKRHTPDRRRVLG